jgi:murein L,D-transpeptidase YafK
MISMAAARLFALLLGATLLCAALPHPAAARNSRAIDFVASRYGPEVPLADLVRDSSLVLTEDGHLADARIEVIKKTYELRLFVGGRRIKTYRIQLGKQPIGPKSRKGDFKTPEGVYRICHHNPGSRYYLSLQIDYPNEADIARALDAKAATAAEAARLREQLAGGGCPTLRTRLGGDIFLHGQHPGVTCDIRREGRRKSARKDLQPGDEDPTTMKSGYNWTVGCIALTNPDIRELYRYIANGTTIEIHP